MTRDVSELRNRLAVAIEAAGFVIVDRGADWLYVERQRGFYVPSGPGINFVKPTWSCRVRVMGPLNKHSRIVLSRIAEMPVSFVQFMTRFAYALSGLVGVMGIYSLVLGAVDVAGISAACAIVFALIGRFSHTLRFQLFESIANRHALALLAGAISMETDAPLSVRTIC
jgi:hypothetical protein